MTKKLLIAAALATAVASPALAQVQSAPFDQGNRQNGRVNSINRSYDVYHNGQYVGSDPDPNIRLQLRRDHDSTEW